MEEQANEKQERKRKDYFGMVNSTVLSTRFPRVFIARLQEFTFTAVVSKNVFCQGMVPLINIDCGFLSGMLHVHKSEVRDAVFERR